MWETENTIQIVEEMRIYNLVVSGITENHWTQSV